MTDEEIQEEIERLVAEEQELRGRGEGEVLSDTQRARLSEVKVELDRLWDLLRQRRAREEFGQDPDRVHERDADTVEDYLQ